MSGSCFADSVSGGRFAQTALSSPLHSEWPLVAHASYGKTNVQVQIACCRTRAEECARALVACCTQWTGLLLQSVHAVDCSQRCPLAVLEPQMLHLPARMHSAAPQAAAVETLLLIPAR